MVCRLDMLNQLDPKRDLRICGQVIYTGKSSMEVVVKMESIGAGVPNETVMIGASCSSLLVWSPLKTCHNRAFLDGMPECAYAQSISRPSLASVHA